MIIRGMGELHLDIIVDRLRREYGVEANVGRPQVVHRETLAKTAEAEARFERVVEDETLFGHARVRVAPRPRGAGNVLRMELARVGARARARRSSRRRRAILDAAMEGAREAMRSGPQGYPIEDIEVVVIGVEYRPDASTPAGQKAAVGEALRQAWREAGTRLLEPIMRVEVTCPEANVGDVLGDLNARRAQIEDVGLPRRAAGHHGEGARCGACSATRRTCAARPRAARRTRCSSRPTTPGSDGGVVRRPIAGFPLADVSAHAAASSDGKLTIVNGADVTDPTSTP